MASSCPTFESLVFETFLKFEGETVTILANSTDKTTVKHSEIIGCIDAINKEFIVSDGSHNLHFWDYYETLAEKRRIEVKFGKYNQEGQQVIMHKIPYLNEREWDSHDGTILSNIWYSNTIIRINPTIGLVEHGYNFDNLYTDRKETEDCFNGIALSDTHGELYVTGKWWPNLYRVRLVER